MHDVFIVTSEGSGCGHIARIVYAFDEVDARQTIQDSYRASSSWTSSPDETRRRGQEGVRAIAGQESQTPAEWSGF